MLWKLKYEKASLLSSKIKQSFIVEEQNKHNDFNLIYT